VAPTLSLCTSVKCGGMSSNSATVKAIKFAGPRMSYVSVHIQFCSPEPDDGSSIDIGGGYHLWSSKSENRPDSPFPSGILHFPLIALPGLT
jgi:hypothetical protein